MGARERALVKPRSNRRLGNPLLRMAGLWLGDSCAKATSRRRKCYRLVQTTLGYRHDAPRPGAKNLGLILRCADAGGRPMSNSEFCHGGLTATYAPQPSPVWLPAEKLLLPIARPCAPPPGSREGVSNDNYWGRFT